MSITSLSGAGSCTTARLARRRGFRSGALPRHGYRMPGGATAHRDSIAMLFVLTACLWGPALVDMILGRDW